MKFLLIFYYNKLRQTELYQTERRTYGRTKKSVEVISRLKILPMFVSKKDLHVAEPCKIVLKVCFVYISSRAE